VKSEFAAVDFHWFSKMKNQTGIPNGFLWIPLENPSPRNTIMKADCFIDTYHLISNIPLIKALVKVIC
jgi:hypothetical protein